MSHRTAYMVTILLILLTCSPSSSTANRSSSRSNSHTRKDTFSESDPNLLTSIFSTLTNYTKVSEFMSSLTDSDQISSLKFQARRFYRLSRIKLRRFRSAFSKAPWSYLNGTYIESLQCQAQQAWWKLTYQYTDFFQPLAGDLLTRARKVNKHTIPRFFRRMRSMGPFGALLQARTLWTTAEFAAPILGYVRGELHVVVLALILLMAFRPVLIDGVLEKIVGPSAVVGGVWMCACAIADLGAERLSVWLAPVEGVGLVTWGVYGSVRHPFYAGLLLVASGMGLWSRSPARVVMAGVLFAFLIRVVEVEERFLREAYFEYWAYAERVGYRLVPGVF